MCIERDKMEGSRDEERVQYEDQCRGQKRALKAWLYQVNLISFISHPIL